VGEEGGEAGLTFTTIASVALTPLALPDHRAYELVSPLDDTEVFSPENAYFESGAGEFFGPRIGYRAAADGDAVAYTGESPASGVGGDGTGPNSAYANRYLGARGPEGWEASDISLPIQERIATSRTEFGGFSDDLSVQMVNSNQQAAAVLKSEPLPVAGCVGAEGQIETEYTHTASGFHALITANQGPGCSANLNAGVSADDSHILLYTNNLYDSVDGQLHQVNVLPDGELEQHPNAAFGSGATFVGDVSNDGARVFWTDLNTEVTPEDPAGLVRLFVRENDAAPQSPIGPKRECTVAGDACTVQVDAAKGGPGASGGGKFWAASGDGSKVFFTDESQLTAGSTAVSGEPDLYEYEVSSEAGGPGKLTDLTVAKAGHADVTEVVGTSEASAYDGSYVYFVAHGVLTQGPNAEGREPVAGQPNLYMSHDGVTTFVASGDAVGTSLFSVEMAAGGHAVGFMSSLPLTGYDNTNNDNEAVPELFVYEADRARILCASCSPDGAPPILSQTEARSRPNEDGSIVSVGSSGTPMYNPRWINDTGTQVYFATNQALVPQDTNERDDVYEWEVDGSGGCGQAAGCVTPLSDVNSPYPAYFIEASASGEDVFFAQRASLVPRAVDEAVKLYDARVDGGFPETSLSCTGTGCQGVPPAPPIFSTPASVTFEGVGNFPPPPAVVKPPGKHKAAKCPRGKTRNGHGKCVKTAKAKAKKAKKSTHHKGSR
jgi:hypothetical protein